MTFHSACARMLRAEAPRLGYTRQFTIYDQADSRRLVKRCIDELGVDPKRFTPAAVQNQISDAKNKLRDAGGLPRARRRPTSSRPSPTSTSSTRARLHQMNAMDFDDLLGRTVNVLELFPEVRARYARDVPPRARRRVPGHEPRAVPAAAAARRRAPQPRGRRRRRPVDLRLPRRRHPQHPRLPGRLPGRARSSSSSRTTARRRRSSTPRTPSSPTTASRCTSTCGPTSARATRSSSASSTTSTPRRATSSARSSGWSTRALSRSEIAVFYRTNAQSRVLEDTLVRREIGYQVIGGTQFYERAEIKDAIAYLTLLANPQDASASRASPTRRGAASARRRSRACSRTPNTMGISVWDAAADPAARPRPRRRRGQGDRPLHGDDDRAARARRSRACPIGDLLDARAARDAATSTALEAERTIEAQGRHREPRSSSSRSRASSTPPPRPARTASTSSCSRSRSSPTPTRARTTRASSR